jgi:hypothetical protein
MLAFARPLTTDDHLTHVHAAITALEIQKNARTRRPAEVACVTPAALV